MAKAKRKSATKLKHLKAKALVIERTDGSPAIYLSSDAIGDPVDPILPSIGLFSTTRKILDISVQTGGPVIQLWNTAEGGHTNLSLGGLWMMSGQGILRAILGLEPESKAHRLLLLKKGIHSWQSPRGDGQAAAQALNALGYNGPEKPRKKRSPASP